MGISPHDRYVRQAFSHMPLVREFLEHHLPSEVLKRIDLSGLAPVKDSFVEDNLRQKTADLLYTVPFRNSPGYMYILIEHTSSSHPRTPFRVFQYTDKIMEQHMRRNKSNILPIVYPIVFYTGERPFRHSTDIFDMFGDEKKLARFIYSKSISLIDLNHISNAELESFQYFQALGLVMKYIRSPKLLSSFQKALRVLDKLPGTNAEDIGYLQSTVSYIWEAAAAENFDPFAKMIRTTLNEKGELFMTIAEMLRQEGREEGEKRGEHKRSKTIAGNLLDMGLGISGVAQGTGLSIEEVKVLQEQRSLDLHQSA